MAFIVTGVDGKVLRKTIQLRHEVQSRAVLNFTVVHEAPVTPAVGTEITVTDGELLFSGHIWEHNAEPILGTDQWRTHISCVDHRWLVDRRVMNLEYPEVDPDPGTSVGAIVRDIVSSFSDITAGNIIDGPSIQRPMIFDARYAHDIIHELADRAGCFWGVTKHKQLFFHEKDAVSGPSVDPSDILQFKIGADKSHYFDKVHLVNVQKRFTIEDRWPRSYINGERREFPTLRPIAKRGVQVDAWPEVVFGERDVDEVADWWYTVGQAELEQDEAGTPLTLDDFDDFLPVYTAMERITVTQGSGDVERVFDGNSIHFDDAEGFADALIAKYGKPLVTVQFTSYKTLEPGTWCAIGSFGNYLITRMSVEDPGRADRKLLRTYYGVNEEPLNNALQFFERWQKKAISSPFGDSQGEISSGEPLEGGGPGTTSTRVIEGGEADTVHTYQTVNGGGIT